MRQSLFFLASSWQIPLSYACVGHSQYSPAVTHHPPDIPLGNLGRTAIANVRVFDGYTIGPPQTVLIDGDRIGSPNCQVASTYDAKGRILIPGLFDSHVHPGSVSALHNLTSYGITTAINMACQNYTLCHQLKNSPGVASFVSAGLPAVGPDSSHAKWGKTPPDNLFYNTSETQWVDNVFTNGSDFLKITAEIGGPSLESQYKLVANAHARGKPTATHASKFFTYQYAIDTRTDNVQHVPLDGNVTAEMARAIVRQRQTVTPTINAPRAAAENPMLLSFLGASGPVDPQAGEAILRLAKANLKTLYEAGVTILAGTDATGYLAPTINLPFGSSLHQELVDLVDAGMSPAEALRAATSVPAYVHRQFDRGHILPGMRADMVLLNSDPLANISNTLDIEKVWVGGREYAGVHKLSS